MIRQLSRGLALLASLAILGCGNSVPDAAKAITPISHDLDGKTYVIMLKQGDKAPTKDDLIFKDGTFDSVDCRQYGYALCAYEATKTGDAMQFEASAISAKYGKNHWRGTVKADGSVTGTMDWDNAGKKTKYTFTGKMK